MVASANQFVDLARPTNVASVPQRSPFRYPGGKTWLIPFLRNWLRSLERRPRLFVEPFAGGGVASLTVAAEGLAEKVLLGELDAGVAAVWKVALGPTNEWLVRQILDFRVTRTNVLHILRATPTSEPELAFQTLVRNRVQRGGIMAPGASLVRRGENGRGLRSRWYPQTLARRLRAIYAMRDRISFEHADAFSLIPRFLGDTSVAMFVDPPYTAGGKRAGRRMYLHCDIDHRQLFGLLGGAAGPVAMTYDEAPEVLRLAREFGFHVERVPMKNAHHAVMFELLLTNRGSCTRRVGPSQLSLFT